MADDRDPRPPEPGRRRDDDQDARRPDEFVTSPLRTEPPSVPARISAQARRSTAATPTVVPLARRRSARIRPRPADASTAGPTPADVGSPGDDGNATVERRRPSAGTPPVAGTPPAARPPAPAPPTAPTTKLPTPQPATPPPPTQAATPQPASPPSATPPRAAAPVPPTAPVATGLERGAGSADETPTTANPVAPTPAEHLPTEQVPTSAPPSPAPPGPERPGPETSTPASRLPTERMPAAPNPARPPAPRSRPGTPRPTTASARPPGPAVAPAAPPPSPAPPSSRPDPDDTTAAAPEEPVPAGRTTNSVRTHDPDWAATSTVLAGFGGWLAGLRRTWTWLRTGKLVAATVAFVVLATTGVAWAGLTGLVREIGALDPDSSAIRDAAAQRGDQNFLVVGSDTRIGAIPDEDAGDAADVPGARADTVMVVHVPQDRSRVTVVSFPRDLEISRPACEHWDPVSGQYSSQSVPRTPQVKLNSAYAAGGPRCVTKVVQELSGLAINHFLGVDFQGFKGMVDAVHGVPICVEKPIRDGILGTVLPRAGTSVLTGDQALNFVRARHVIGDPTSDYGRIQRQQRFLSSLLRTTLSAGTLLDPGKLKGFVEAVSRSTFGENVGADQLLGLGQSLGDLNPATVTFTTIPTTGTANSRGNEVPRPAADRDLFASIIDNRPMPGQAPAPAPGAPPVPAPPPLAPQQVTARLVDARGSGDDSGSSRGSSSDDASGRGAGSRVSSSSVASDLRAEGFTVVPTTDPVVLGERTTLRFSPDQAPAAVLLSRSVPGAAFDPGSPTPGTLTLILGDDFDGNVGPAAAQRSGPVVPTITAADARCT